MINTNKRTVIKFRCNINGHPGISVTACFLNIITCINIYVAHNIILCYRQSRL